ncbi:hypothetical protein FACS189430_09630 [Bacteroidia bacterium]|nr:hypothetical protein FACS189430_09630 [Bacteroidia bacterium]
MKNKYLFIISLLVFSCGKEDMETTFPVDKTVIVYMAADNDLSIDAYADIEEMKKGFTENGTNLIVFIYGLSCYIPHQQLHWCNAAGFSNLF